MTQLTTKYQIFELTEPQDLAFESNFRGSAEYLYRTVLEEIGIEGMVTEHDSMDAAMNEIMKFNFHLKKTKLTILPIITVKKD